MRVQALFFRNQIRRPTQEFLRDLCQVIHYLPPSQSLCFEIKNHHKQENIF